MSLAPAIAGEARRVQGAIRNAMTVDVEDYFQVQALSDVVACAVRPGLAGIFRGPLYVPIGAVRYRQWVVVPKSPFVR